MFCRRLIHSHARSLAHAGILYPTLRKHRAMRMAWRYVACAASFVCYLDSSTRPGQWHQNVNFNDFVQVHLRSFALSLALCSSSFSLSLLLHHHYHLLLLFFSFSDVACSVGVCLFVYERAAKKQWIITMALFSVERSTKNY